MQNIAVFVLLPLAIIAAVFIAVSAPGWIRAAQAEEEGIARPEGPLRLTSPAGTMAAPSGPGIQAPTGPTIHTEPGGASAQW